MHYILFLELERFYASRDSLQVIYRTLSPSEKLILDASPMAMERGITPGMSLIEAKTLLGREGVFVPWRAEDYRDRQKAWLDLAMKYTDVLEPIDQHQAFLDLSEQREPDGLVKLLVAELEGLGYGVRWGAGGCRWVAQTAAEVGDVYSSALLTPRRFVAGLSLARLRTVVPEVRRRLLLLGYTRIGELTEVPYESLQKQFGAVAFEIRRAAQGGGDSHVLSLYPERCARARITFEGQVTDEIALRSSLHELAQRLVKRLEGGDWVGRSIELSLEYEEGFSPIYTRSFTQPLAELAKIRRALELVLPWPPTEPPVGIRVQMPELERAQRRQVTFETERKDTEAVEATLARLGRTFGEDSVRPASLDTPRTRFLRAFKDACGWS